MTEIKSVVGQSPFFNKRKSLKIDIEKLDSLLSGNLDLNCLSTSRAINGLSVGSESLFEDLSYKLDVNPKVILDLLRKNISLLKQTKAKYFNDLLHKIILNELGVKQISIYRFEVINTQRLIEQLKRNYPFLNSQSDLPQTVILILSLHHKVSFFNKPLISFSKESLTVGQLHNG